jgi:DNA-binding transcriptional LysR family regulator
MIVTSLITKRHESKARREARATMELTHLRYFYNVAKSRSFVRGARLSHVTPPAVSKAIKKLEEELGTPLLVRTTRHTSLTQTGEVLFEECQQVFDAVERLERALETTRDTIAGPLRVGALEVFSVELLPVALCRLLERFPNIVPSSFELLPQAMDEALLHGSLDVGFTLGSGTARGLTTTTIGTTPGRLVCGAGHPLYGIGRITRKGLREHPFVVPRFFAREHLPAVDQFPDDVHPRQVGATIELLQMGIRMVMGGSLLGYFPEVSIRRWLDDGSLRALSGVRLGAPFQLVALTREGIAPKAATQELIGELRSLVR